LLEFFGIGGFLLRLGNAPVDLGGAANLRTRADREGKDRGSACHALDPAALAGCLALLPQVEQSQWRCAWSWQAMLSR